MLDVEVLAVAVLAVEVLAVAVEVAEHLQLNEEGETRCYLVAEQVVE